MRVNARVSGQEVVVTGLRSVAGKNGNYAAAGTVAGHSTSSGFPDMLQPQTTSLHHSFHSSLPGAAVNHRLTITDCGIYHS